MTMQVEKPHATFHILAYLGYDDECEFCNDGDCLVWRYHVIEFGPAEIQEYDLQGHSDCIARFVHRNFSRVTWEERAK